MALGVAPGEADRGNGARIGTSRLRAFGLKQVYALSGGYPLEPKGGMTELHQPF